MGAYRLSMLTSIGNKLNIKDMRRFRWSISIFLCCLVYLLMLCGVKEKIVYEDALTGFENLFRIIWVLPFTFLGFAFVAFMVAKDGTSKDAPWSSYLFSYFPRLIALTLVIFSILHLFESSSGYLFYPFSAGLSLYFGYRIDALKLEDLWKKG